MSTLNTFVAPLAACNLHLCFYGALGAVLLLRAALALSDRKFEEAGEHGAHGIVYFFLGFL